MKRLIALVVCTGLSAPSWGAISNCTNSSLGYGIVCVQGAENETTLSVTTFTMAFGSSVHAGNKLVAVFRLGGTTPTGITVSDDVNPGLWTLASSAQDATNGRALYTYYLDSSLAGLPTVTVSWTNAVATDGGAIFEFSGLDKSRAIDQSLTACDTTSNSAPSSGNMTSTAPLEMVIGGFTMASGGTQTVSAEAPNFTTIASDTIGTASHCHVGVAYRLVGSVGQYIYNPTLSAVSAGTCGAVTSFRADNSLYPSMLMSMNIDSGSAD